MSCSRCENKKTEWQVRANDVHVPLNDIISASNIQIRFLKLPLFWIPSFKGNVRKFLRAPVTWKFHFGGTQGSRVSMRYRFLSQNDFNAYLRVDYRFSKGLGGGVETEYKPKDSDRRFFTRNYVTSDSTLSDDRRRNRYRFQGKYEDRFFDRIRNGHHGIRTKARNVEPNVLAHGAPEIVSCLTSHFVWPTAPVNEQSRLL